jgi:cell division septation protein DedD
MAENRRGKDRRYFFTLGQMVLLGAAFALTCLIVFLFGIVIGKGIEARKMVTPEEPLVKMPIKPSVQGSTGAVGAAPKEELTFYETLTRAPRHQAGLEENGRGKDEKHTAALNRDPLRDGKQREPTRAAVPAPEKKPEQTASLPTATATPPAEGAAHKDNGKLWTVQVNAYPDERSARQLVDQLKNKGYNAQVTETRNNGKTWYRVRVGSYRSREQADKALADLKSKEKFDKAFATSRQQ